MTDNIAAWTKAVRVRAEMTFWEDILEVVEPIAAELGDEDIDVVQALRIAARRGNEQAIAFWDDLEAAVTLDPDWSVGEDGVAVPKQGATYDCPEKLVAAYRAGRLDDSMPIEDVLGSIRRRAFRFHGIKN
jgi:hypothetical protein